MFSSHKSYVPRSPSHETSAGRDAASTYASGQKPNEKNVLDIAKIEEGLDTRTTVMIKNIPNKMSDKDLLNFIGKVSARKIDFLYLRMDFQNGKPRL